MNDKPTFYSVTTQLCECGYLQRAADEPGNPIEFIKEMNEFVFTYGDYPGGKANLAIYHCPWCGGVAPQSKRDQLFVTVSREEKDRLAEVLRPIKTIEDAITKFGNPDFEGSFSTTYQESESMPPTTVCGRRITYYDLSEVADVCFLERADGKAGWTIEGKDKRRIGKTDHAGPA